MAWQPESRKIDVGSIPRRTVSERTTSSRQTSESTVNLDECNPAGSARTDLLRCGTAGLDASASMDTAGHGRTRPDTAVDCTLLAKGPSEKRPSRKWPHAINGE